MVQEKVLLNTFNIILTSKQVVELIINSRIFIEENTKD